jgi:hypothetical protein
MIDKVPFVVRKVALLIVGMMVFTAGPQGLAQRGTATPTVAPQSSMARNLAGTYRCGPNAKACEWVGTTITIVQSGNQLDFKSNKGDVARGDLTSDVSVAVGAPWNMAGSISADGRTIEWSNGTIWTKEKSDS